MYEIQNYPLLNAHMHSLSHLIQVCAVKASKNEEDVLTEDAVSYTHLRAHETA